MLVFYIRLNIIVTPSFQTGVGDGVDQAVNLIIFYLYMALGDAMGT